MPLTDVPAVEITVVGGPTAVLTIAGVRFITDPTFDPPGGEYASGTVTLRKTTGPALTPAQVGKVDVALVSHDQHADNLDHGGRELLRGVPLVLTTHSGAQRLGNGAVGLAPWQSRMLRAADGTPLRVTATPARHGPVGIEKFTGEVVGFVVSIDGGPDLVYVTGDTVWYEGTAQVAQRYHPRVVLLFGGAAMTRGPFHLTMDTNEAIEAAAAFADATFVPVHHDGWAHFTQSQQDLAKAFQALGFGERLREVAPGETITIDASRWKPI